MQLRFASFAVINLREDFHLQECARAGRTIKKRAPEGARFSFAFKPGEPGRNQKTCVMPMLKRDGSAPPVIVVPSPETRSVEPTPVPRP